MRALELFRRRRRRPRASAGRIRDVVGVDIVDQPHYPGRFILGDVLELDRRLHPRIRFRLRSPPCQRYTSLQARARQAPRRRPDRPDARAPDRRGVDLTALRTSRPRAPGSAIPCCCAAACLASRRIPTPRAGGLSVTDFSKRRFRSQRRPASTTTVRVVGIYGGHFRDRRRDQGSNHRSGSNIPRELGFKAMGIPLGAMTTAEISDAIPPAYARFIAQTFLNSRRRILATADDDLVSAERGAGP